MINEQQVIDLINQGKTYLEIGKILGLDGATSTRGNQIRAIAIKHKLISKVHQNAYNAAITARRNRKEETNISRKLKYNIFKDQVLALRRKGLGIDDINEMTGCSKAMVVMICKDAYK